MKVLDLNKIKNIIIGLLLLFMTSCISMEYATTQDDIYVEYEKYAVKPTVSFSIVLQYGTPYYYNGSLLYYLYDGLYYYPYRYNDYWYVRTYSRPFNHLRYKPYFRPSRYDYKFGPNLNRRHHFQNYPKPHIHHNGPGYHKPGNNINRPPHNKPPQNHNKGHFGEHR